MEEYSWYDAFIDNLNELYPKKAQLAEELIDLLCIEREAAYRRLRKEVIFPMHEIVKIAAAWDISLDEIIGIHSGLISFQMQPLNYVTPSNKEMSNLLRKVKSLEHLEDCPNAEYMEICNRLPRPIYIKSMTLYRFEIFKWLYQYNTDKMYTPYSQIIVPEKICRQFELYTQNIKNIAQTSFILDQKLFEHLIHSIKYFHSIALVTDEEKEQIKVKLFEMLQYLMEIATKGCYPDTQKKVNIYISQLTINTNYSYYYTDKFKACRIHAFGKHDVNSYNLEMVEQFKIWMDLKKRTSIQISETNDKYRFEFYTKQKQLIETL
jgi:hypothetical protein